MVGHVLCHAGSHTASLFIESDTNDDASKVFTNIAESLLVYGSEKYNHENNDETNVLIKLDYETMIGCRTF